MHADEKKLRVRQQGLQTARRLNSVEQRHGNVQQNDVRLKLWSKLEQRAPVFHFTDNVELGFQQLPVAFHQKPVIVSNQQARATHLLSVTPRAAARLLQFWFPVQVWTGYLSIH